MAVHIGVDVGGTFTDIAIAVGEENRLVLYKTPSTPDEPDRAIVEGLSRALAENAISAADVVLLAHGTTVGTNALIQRRVGKVAVVTGRGYRDLLEIGRQIRPKVYDMHTDFPDPLVPRKLRLEVGERMRADGIVHRPLAEDEVREAGEWLRAEGADCVVVCFLHSHLYPANERRAAEILREVMSDTTRIIASSDVYPEFREYERFSTAVLNGALLTVMDAYLDRFTRAVGDLGIGIEPTVSQSAGGLMSVGMSREFPVRSALSGPAAGVIGAAQRAGLAGFGDVITLDVGGTSTDVSLLSGGEPSLVGSRRLAGFPLRLPTLDVNAVGAGGGSIAWIDRDGLLKVGPGSAGADPGPACYGRGGEAATVTDANVLLGRLPGDSLLDGRMAIRRDLAEAAVDALAAALGLERMETAHGIVRVTSAVIVKAIRTISIERGFDPTGFTLFAFGGAGPLHAIDVARELAIERVVVPPNPGILCAEGLLASDLAADFIRFDLNRFDAGIVDGLRGRIAELEAQVAGWARRETVADGDLAVSWGADMRYVGQNFELTIPFEAVDFGAATIARLATDFHLSHERAYGFAQDGEPMELVSVRVRAVGRLEKPRLPELPRGEAPGAPSGERQVMFEGAEWSTAAIYRRDALVRDQLVAGPAVIEQMDSTVPISPGDRARVDAWGNLIIERAAE